jgi:glycosyltransferase involved in cell wall biosynthesis
MVTPAPALGPSPMVSVIIATFNWSTALRLAIRSVLGQTLQAFEILVVGDACTDDSEALVEAFGDARAGSIWRRTPAASTVRTMLAWTRRAASGSPIWATTIFGRLAISNPRSGPRAPPVRTRVWAA